MGVGKVKFAQIRPASLDARSVYALSCTNFGLPRDRNARWYSSQIRSENAENDYPEVDEHVHNNVNVDHSQLKQMPMSQWELHKNLLRDPDQPTDAKVLKVAIIGAPNGGKSTLTNMLMGWRISSTSSKVHTTRSRIHAVLTEEEKQIIFLDTPGIINPTKLKKHNLERTLLVDPHSSLIDADIISVVVDVSVPWGRQELDREILKALLFHTDKQSILILNKVDALKSKQALLTTTRILTEGTVGGRADSQLKRKATDTQTPTRLLRKLLRKESEPTVHPDMEMQQIYDTDSSQNKEKFHSYYAQLRRLNRQIEGRRGYNKFSEVFMVCAKDGDGVPELREFLLAKAQLGDWMYHSEVLTDQEPHSVAQQCVWEKLMDHLPKEVPYNVDVELTMWKEDEYGVLRIAMDLHCYSARHLKLLVGRKGTRVRQIAEEAKQELMNSFRKDLTLLLFARLSNKKK